MNEQKTYGHYKGPVEGRMLLFEYNIPEKTCCSTMFFHLTEKEQIMRYQKSTRIFGIFVKDSVIQTIQYCPWCGRKLPKQLGQELASIIFDGLNLDSYDDPRMPEEFKTDEWWKKRNL